MAAEPLEASKREEQSRLEFATEAVFIGARFKWRQQVGDLTMNSEMAEQWEDEFTHWSIDGRSVHLRTSSAGYRVHLGDGRAYFAFESPSIYRVAVAHMQQFLEVLQKRDRERLQARFQIECLHEVELSFIELRDALGTAFLNREAHDALGVKLDDFNYLVDVTREGHWYQINVGPVRAEEIPRRAMATNIDPIPETAVYYLVSGEASPNNGLDIEDQLGRVSNLADDVRMEVLP